MEPNNVEAIPTYTKVHRLHSIKEDDSEAIEPMAELTNQLPIEDKSLEHLEECANGQSQVSGLTAAVHSSRSIVASMKKAISSINPNAVSSVQDFIHINDCLKEKSEKNPEQTEAIVSDLNIYLVMVRGGVPDPKLQAELRNRLRLLENDNKEVAAVFCELSARLLSIESDKDIITVTFRTLEEIWKFSTYYSLGLVNHCMENIFLDQSFWLTSPEEEDTGIKVLLSEASLSLIYKSLLMEEGMYFVLCSDNSVEQAVVVDGTVQIMQSSAAEGPSTAWPETDPSTSDRELSPQTITEPLCPFHQWFLKTNLSADLMGISKSGHGNHIVSTGWVEAMINHEGEAPDEISYQSGDMIEIVTTYIECMEWFVGRNLTTGSVGFVQTYNMKPYMSDKGQKSTSFPIDDNGLSREGPEEDLDFEEAKILLKNISQSDVCHLYKLDQFKETDIFQNKENVQAKSTSSSNNLKEKLEAFMNMSAICLPSLDTSNDLQDVGSVPSQVSTILDECEDPIFCICVEGENHDSLQPLLSFLNNEQFQQSFKKLYDVSYTFLQTLFHGYNEEELVRYLSIARGEAKKSCMKWAQARICFLLGRLCTKKNKFSQARVYFEEAMGVINGDFSDIFLFAAVQVNLNAIYLKQKSKDKSCQMIDKSSALLLGLQNYINCTEMESTILKYAMKKAILRQDLKSEVKVCQLLAKTFIDLRQHNEALPFIERLQALDNLMDTSKSFSSEYYFQLADIYTKKCLPNLTFSCVKVASQTSCSIMDSLRRISFINKNSSKPCGTKKPSKIFPSQVAYHLKHALKSVVTDQDQELCCFIYLSLADMCSNHRLYEDARSYIMKAMDSYLMDIKYRVDILVSLAWLYMLDGENSVSLDILNRLVSFSYCTQHQLGIAHNLVGIALRGEGKIEESARHYCMALQISREVGNVQDQAAVLANFGMLFLHLKARILAEVFLVKSVTLYSGLPMVEIGPNFIYVLLMLGSHYIAGDHKEEGKSFYEWALLVAMESNHLEGQLRAVQLLCHFYNTLEVNEAQCIIYNEYQLSLAKKMSDKVLEGQVLETISQLYLSLGTERACRSALEYTKRSLGIFIDLQSKEREAYAWLMAGKIYYILGQNELVDLYIQVAQNVALCTGDPQLGMELYEASGDIFFNGASDRNKATTFYRDCALPLAVKTENVTAELRLCNKLTELLISTKSYEEALEHAKMALALSVNLGNPLNERVSYHRLAGIYSHLNQSELAEHFYLKALSLCSSPLQLEEESVYYMKVYLVLGDIIFYDLKDPYDAAGYYHLALAAAMDLGNKKSQLKIYTRLAVIYHNFLVDREKSLYFYQKARTFATELNVRRINLSPGQQYQNLARTYSC
ncbi:SH3 domain and tetratricopeptide repeat-containing protein 1 [Hyla sarda]|uniref:SH3 domain and tetratricopeptide repeat-containing protein 1 n=1 Tax=Hyla sarda TaxID=327740 RepID=UPI0024C46E67|nr:SH3 domain and tetratricopeptide repeat-containing protein 1 [Hyla sarda]XP_056411016.1 SH3 domain and tetratricopeptide repeat-containing protein 1 [Hyla sarda]XP_056411017.1 SH3 domain and tetratricopeptide repeat-containing protein 1 [Hyla sarda]XP_056411018.1 SH3 domain and tetratricopeptide repeat-containing protein 1 [Hyla sarda]